MPEIELRLSGYGRMVRSGGTPFIVRFELAGIRGAGRFHASHVQIPLRFQSRQIDADLQFIVSDLLAELHLGSTSSAPPSTDTLISRVRQFGMLAAYSEFQFLVALPLTAQSVEHIEDFRKGKDLEISLYLHAKLAVRSISQESLKDVDSAYGISSFRIPRSYWVDHVLPGMGYLTKYILEIDVPRADTLSEKFQQALKEFKNAEISFQQDNYDEVLVKCRNSIDAMASAFRLELGEEPATYRNRVEAFQTQHLQPRVGSTKAKLVADELLALWGPLSAATKPGPFVGDRPAAKYVLQATANLLSYLGKIFLE